MEISTTCGAGGVWAAEPASNTRLKPTEARIRKLITPERTRERRPGSTRASTATPIAARCLLSVSAATGMQV
jgi:hypothetical protein